MLYLKSLLCLGCISILGVFAGARQQMNAEPYVTGWVRGLNAYSDREIHVSEHTESRDLNGSIEQRISSTHELVRNAQNWRQLTRTRIVTRDKKGKEHATNENSEKLFSPSRALLVALDPQGDQATGVVAWLDDSSAAKKELGNDLCSAPWTAWLPWNERYTIPELLAMSVTHVTKQRNDAGDLVVVRSTSDWGSLEVYFDPARGVVPIRVQQSKLANNKYSTTSVVGNLKNGRLNRNYLAITQRADFFPSRQPDGSFLITSMKYKEEITYTDHRVTSTSQEATYTYRDAPAAAGDETPQYPLLTFVPNGMFVNVVNHPGILYSWENGELVKPFNMLDIFVLGNNKFIPGGLLGMLSLVIVTLVIVYITLRWNRSVRMSRTLPGEGHLS